MLGSGRGGSETGRVARPPNSGAPGAATHQRGERTRASVRATGTGGIMKEHPAP